MTYVCTCTYVHVQLSSELFNMADIVSCQISGKQLSLEIYIHHCKQICKSKCGDIKRKVNWYVYFAKINFVGWS